MNKKNAGSWLESLLEKVPATIYKWSLLLLDAENLKLVKPLKKYPFHALDNDYNYYYQIGVFL